MVGGTELHKWRWITWFSSILIYAISLACPTFCSNASCDGFGGGAGDLMLGWLGAFLAGGAYVAWFANPFFLIAILSNKKYPWLSLIMSFFALIVGLNFLRGGGVLLNEAGNKGYIVDFQIGYWLWLLSFLSMAVASVFSIRLPNSIVDHHIDER